jgi:hypothetical protein
MFAILLPEIEYAWIVCPLGPQRFDCDDRCVDDYDGGVFGSIAEGRVSRFWPDARADEGGTLKIRPNAM